MRWGICKQICVTVSMCLAGVRENERERGFGLVRGRVKHLRNKVDDGVEV